MQEITVYSTTFCPYCDAAKRLLTQRGYTYKEVDLTNDHEKRVQLSKENNGWRTVPMIFIGNDFVGGFTELATLDKSGSLKSKVES